MNIWNCRELLAIDSVLTAVLAWCHYEGYTMDYPAISIATILFVLITCIACIAFLASWQPTGLPERRGRHSFPAASDEPIDEEN